jgi:hypothetical protein
MNETRQRIPKAEMLPGPFIGIARTQPSDGMTRRTSQRSVRQQLLRN